jgi:hypothetical protein
VLIAPAQLDFPAGVLAKTAGRQAERLKARPTWGAIRNLGRRSEAWNDRGLRVTCAIRLAEHVVAETASAAQAREGTS